MALSFLAIMGLVLPWVVTNVVASTLVRVEPHGSITGLLQVADGLQSKRQACPEMEARTFNFEDEQCGHLTYKLSDLVGAFHTEQKYWSEQGATNPWWAVLTHEKKGTDIPKSKQIAFYESGVNASQAVAAILKSAGFFDAEWASRATALDLGCGLGRMSNGLAWLGFQQVLCVDQAQSFLDAAAKSLTELAGQGKVLQNATSVIKFVQSNPALLCTVKPSSVDFVHSVISLQHMKPMLQVAYIEQLCDVLRVGGRGWFQIPVKLVMDNPDNRCNLEQNLKIMAMHYTPEHEVVHHLESRGCKLISSGDWDVIGGKRAGTSMYFSFVKSNPSV